MFGVGERMKRSFDFGAGSAGVILRPRRQVSGKARLKSTHHNDGNEDRASGYRKD
jgi:hypothetical protein